MKKFKILFSIFCIILLNKPIYSMKKDNFNKIINIDSNLTKEENRYIDTVNIIIKNINQNMLLNIKKSNISFKSILKEMPTTYINLLTDELKKVGHQEIIFLDDFEKIKNIIEEKTKIISNLVNENKINTKKEFIDVVEDNLLYIDDLKSILIDLFKTRFNLTKKYLEFNKAKNIEIEDFIKEFMDEKDDIFKYIVLKTEYDVLNTIIKKVALKFIWENINYNELMDIVYFQNYDNMYTISLLYINNQDILSDLIEIKKNIITIVLNEFLSLEKSKKVKIDLSKLRKKYIKNQDEKIKKYVSKITSVELRSLEEELYYEMKFTKKDKEIINIKNQIETLNALRRIVEKIENLTTSDASQSDETNFLIIDPKYKLLNILKYVKGNHFVKLKNDVIKQNNIK